MCSMLTQLVKFMFGWKQNEKKFAALMTPVIAS